MKLLLENWKKFLNEQLDLQAAQQLIDANPYLKGKLKASQENIIESNRYILVVSDESLKHIKDRHMDASAPGSLFSPSLDLRAALQRLLSTKPSEDSGGRVKWLGVDAGMEIGHMGVKLGNPAEVQKLKAFFPAEEYHQQYYKNNNDQPYCKLVIEPKLQKAKSLLSRFYK